MEQKECIKCKINCPISCFSSNEKYIRNVCKKCKNEQTIKRRHERMKEQKEIPTEKECTKCSIIKPIINFTKDSITKDGYDNHCKECIKKARKKLIYDVIMSDINKTCISCHTTKNISEFKQYSLSKDGYYNKCNSCWKPREWNKEKQKQSEKKYCEKNKDKLREKWKKRGQREDVRLKQRLTARIKSAFKIINTRKTQHTYEYIGCTYDFLRKWFEFQFTENMNWNNMGDWHIDHVKPCSSYNLENINEINECFNWKNLRPCWASENLTKSDMIISELIKSQKEKVKEFLNTLPNHPGNRDDGAE